MFLGLSAQSLAPDSSKPTLKKSLSLTCLRPMMWTLLPPSSVPPARYLKETVPETPAEEAA